MKYVSLFFIVVFAINLPMAVTPASGAAGFDKNSRFIEVQQLVTVAVATAEAADLDNDGDMDLILASGENQSIIQVYENQGVAAFRNSGTIFPYESPDIRHWNFGIAVADLNGDALLDIATADAWAGLNVYLNQGGLNFTWSQNFKFDGMGEVKGISTADFNGDGMTDIILGDHNGDSRGDRILMNNGFGLMIDSGQSIGFDITWDVFAVDLNRDGAIDYVSVNRYGYEPARIHFNDGYGLFSRTVDIPDTLDDSYDVKAFFYNGHTYCFIANSEGSLSRRNRMLTFDGEGALVGDRSFGHLGAETKDMKLEDLNRDGIPDLVTANWNSGCVAFLSAVDGEGMLDLTEVPLVQTPSMTAVAVADFDNDGVLDLLVGSESLDSVGGAGTSYRVYLQQVADEMTFKDTTRRGLWSGLDHRFDHHGEGAKSWQDNPLK